MKPGDSLLIYRNSTSQYHAKGQVGPFWHTTYIRDEFWSGGPALDILAVEEYAEIDVQPEDVNAILDYEEHFWLQGLWRVSDGRPTDRVVRRFDI